MSFSLGTQTRGGHRQGDRDLSVPLSVELDGTSRANQKCQYTSAIFIPLFPSKIASCL